MRSITLFCIAAMALLSANLLVFAGTKNGFSLEDTWVPTEENHYGSLPKDGFPSLDNPVFTYR